MVRAAQRHAGLLCAGHAHGTARAPGCRGPGGSGLGFLPAVVDPVAADIGACHVLCTRPEARDGILTGALAGEPCIGEGKRRVVRDLAEGYPDVDLADCYAYGDHPSDLPMLTEVGHPVVVGGSAELLAAIPGARVLPVGAVV